MLEKFELVERMVCSCYVGDMPQQIYDDLVSRFMGMPDRKLIEALEKIGLYYEKVGLYFMCKN